jgi:riboflavin synthase alpha subunit
LILALNTTVNTENALKLTKKLVGHFLGDFLTKLVTLITAGVIEAAYLLFSIQYSKHLQIFS